MDKKIQCNKIKVLFHPKIKEYAGALQNNAL